MLDALEEDYIRTAPAKGLTERRITYRHALRSSLAPVVSQFGIDLAPLMGGAIVTEVVFGLPGLGREAVLAITTPGPAGDHGDHRSSQLCSWSPPTCWSTSCTRSSIRAFGSRESGSGPGRRDRPIERLVPDGPPLNSYIAGNVPKCGCFVSKMM